jgi:2-hydroxychromene-2-carboxylate isomerase
MTKTIDFYFDIISPYSYLAHKKIKKNYKDKKINFNYKPILLGGLHKLAEITAPAFNKFKMNNMKRDCELVANKNNIEFKWNDRFPINSINIMRGYLLVDNELKEEFLDKFFDAYWKNNKDLNIKENFNEVLKI